MSFFSEATSLGLAASASADGLYTFDSDTSGGTQGGTFNGGSYAWSSVFGGAVQHTGTTGGWNLGASGPKFELNWPAQSTMQVMLNTYGNGYYSRIAFDLEVSSDWSFNYGTWAEGDWYELHWAGNSDGISGWTQDYDDGVQTTPVSSVYHLSDPDLSWHFDIQLADLGWAPGDTWFQIFFGSSSSDGNAVQFFIDNIHYDLNSMPEPGAFALASLGAATFYFIRRRE